MGTKELLAQGIGLIAMAMNVLSYQQKTKRGLIAFQLVGATLFAVNFLMLGALVGGILNILGAVRAVVYMNSERFGAHRLAWVLGFSASFVLVYILTFTAFGTPVTPVKLVVELLPVVAMILSTVGFRLKGAKAVRMLGLIVSPCWLVYNLIAGAVGAILCEAISLVSILVGIVRFDLPTGAKGKKRLIVSDLDGTLLTQATIMSEENRGAIEEMSRRGVLFCISTGRALFEIPEEIRKDPHSPYLACSNGAEVYDSRTGERVISHSLTPQQAEAVFRVIDGYDAAQVVHVGGYAYCESSVLTEERFDHYGLNAYYRELFLRLKTCESIRSLVQEAGGAESLALFFADDEEGKACKAELETVDGVAVSGSTPHNAEVFSAGAGKGVCLRELAALLRVSRRQTVAVGDQMNDTSMFAEAGLALCVANGCDEAKKLAHAVICSADEHAAKFILEHYVK